MGLGFVPLKQAVNELKTIQCWTDILAEFYMNFIILFVTIGVAIHVSNVPSQYGMLALAITGGWYVYVSIESWAAVNGAHINPCITVLFICTKRVSFIKGLFYIPSQLAGGTAGVWFLKQCIPDSDVQFIAPLQLHPNITQLQGVGIEWVITSGLMTCALGVLDDRMRELNMPGLTVGTAIIIGILVAGPYTGGCMNPNIAFAPAAVTNKWKDHWVYWVGPMLGVATALVAYYLLSWQRQLIKKKEKEEFSLSMLPKLTLSATTGLVRDTNKINDGSPRNTDVLLGDQEDKNISEYKGFFIKQKQTATGNKNESSTDDTPTQKGFYKKTANIHHRF